MRNLKKFLALVLAMMMTFSLMVTVNAANADPVTDLEDVTEELQEAVSVLNGMGVITGYDDGTFRPQESVRRSEAAALVYRLVTGDWQNNSNELYSTYVKFSDVTSSHAWAAGYIGYCANQEIIKGVGGDRYAPDSTVTGYQLLAMVLRAVGYGQNGEFEGASWQTRVASTATQLGILDNINNTNYAGTLSVAANRELVAEIIFQAAQLPMVRYELGYYNPYIGVASGTGGNILNDSLGYKYYGLASVTGIVVGNQATGEDSTLVGVGVRANFVTNNGTTTVGGYEFNGEVSYEYASSNRDGGTNITQSHPDGSVTLKFDEETGLDLFGHKVELWYDSRSTADVANVQTATSSFNVPSEFATTYAVLDQATKTAVVYAYDKTNIDTADTSATLSDATDKLAKAAKDAGFTVRSAGAMTSDAFGQIVTSEATSGSFTYGGTEGIYALISNSSKNALDVVIALNVDVDSINKVNNYSGNKTVTHTHNTTEIYRSVPKAEDQSLLVYGEDDIAVRQIVVLNKIYGTGSEGITTPGTQFYYGINALTDLQEGTIKGISSTGTVTLSDGTTIERSPLWYTTNGGSGVEYLLINNTVTFRLDVDGKYVACFIGGGEELLGAYAYWQQNPGDIDKITYYLQGVTKDGTIVTKEITQDDYFAKFANQPAGSIPIHHMRNTSTTHGSNLQIVEPDGTGYAAYAVSDEGDVSSAGWSTFSNQGWTENSRELIAGKFLSDQTVFYVVSGYGTTLNVDKYTGLAALLKGAPSVEASGWYFLSEDDSEHATSQNDIVETVILVNTKWIQPSAFLYNYDGYTSAIGGVMTAKQDAVQLDLYVAGEADTRALLVSKIGSNPTITTGPAVDTSLSLTGSTFYTYALTDKGYYELTADNMDGENGDGYGVQQETLTNTGTSFGYIKSANGEWYALNAKVIDITGTNHGITDYETLRRAAEENTIVVDILLTSNGGTTASVIYVTAVS